MDHSHHPLQIVKARVLEEVEVVLLVCPWTVCWAWVLDQKVEEVAQLVEYLEKELEEQLHEVGSKILL
jgi:hypothetical protein